MKCYRKAVRRRFTLFIFNHSREFFCSFLRIFVVEFSLNSDLLQCVSVNLFMLQELHETKAKISDYVKQSWERRKSLCMLVFRQFHNLSITFRLWDDEDEAEKKQKSRTSHRCLSMAEVFIFLGGSFYGTRCSQQKPNDVKLHKYQFVFFIWLLRKLSSWTLRSLRNNEALHIRKGERRDPVTGQNGKQHACDVLSRIYYRY